MSDVPNVVVSGSSDLVVVERGVVSEVDCSTGDIIERPMTDAELAQITTDRTEYAAEVARISAEAAQITTEQWAAIDKASTLDELKAVLKTLL